MKYPASAGKNSSLNAPWTRYAASSDENSGLCGMHPEFRVRRFLEVRKLYPVIDDPDAEANDLIRVIGESGEDYVYTARLFQRLTLPAGIQRALRLAS